MFQSFITAVLLSTSSSDVGSTLSFSIFWSHKNEVLDWCSFPFFKSCLVRYLLCHSLMQYDLSFNAKLKSCTIFVTQIAVNLMDSKSIQSLQWFLPHLHLECLILEFQALCSMGRLHRLEQHMQWYYLWTWTFQHSLFHFWWFVGCLLM